MDRAIDNYSIGRQHEVSAEEIEKLKFGSISAATKRFVCVICGETVRFQCRGKTKKEYFAHLNDEDDKKFCEERIKSNGNYTIYECVGLPIYIKKTINNNFKLCIGFYNIDEKTLSYAENENMFVSVESKFGKAQETGKFFINNSNFSPNGINYKILDFVAERYGIKYSSQSTERLIGKRWGDFAEGILSGGALFTFDDSGGRKIRINEVITTGVDYLLMIQYRNYAPQIEGLDCQFYGEVEFKSYQCKLYKVLFNTVNKRLSDFCRATLKVSLLYRQVSLFPIWPPCSKKDNMLSFFNNVKVGHFAVISDSEMPKIFNHSDNMPSPINVSKKHGSIYTVKVPIKNIVTPLTIDRNSSGGILLINNKLKVKAYKNSVKIFALNDSEYQTCYKIPLKKSLKFISDSTSVVIHKKNVNFQNPVTIRNTQGIVVTDISFGDEIDIFSGAELLNKVAFKKLLWHKKDIIIEDSILSIRLSKMGEPYVVTIYCIKEIMKQLKNKPKSYAILKEYLNYNIMPQGAIVVIGEIVEKMKAGVKNGR